MTDIEHFHRPATVQDALDVKREHGDAAAFLSGGSLLNSLDRPTSPAHLISLAGLSLGAIERHGGQLRLGASVTLQELIDAEDVPPAIRAGCLAIGNRSVRNVATLGGYLGGANSTRDLLPILVALEARVELADASVEDVAILDYLGDPGALVTAMRFPLGSFERSWALARQGRSGSAPPAITAAATVVRDGTLVRSPILALGGVADTVVRLPDVEAALDGRPLPAPDPLEALISRDLQPTGDILGSGDYKRHLAGVLGARVLRDALFGRGGAR